MTKITEQLMDCRSGNDNDDYIYLDPKLLKRGDTLPKTRAPFQDAIVFIVGGGNYIEYQNLVDFIKVSHAKVQYSDHYNDKLVSISVSAKTNRKYK